MKLFLWGMFILPWFTLFLMKKESVRRYMPVGIFTSLVMTIIEEIAYTQKWWILKQKLFPQTVTFVPFVYGLYIVITMWVFYFTYRRFGVYLLTNIVLDAIFAFPAYWMFANLDVFRLFNFTQLGRFFVLVAVALLAYTYQLWQEKVFHPRETEPTEHPIITMGIKNAFAFRRKAR